MIYLWCDKTQTANLCIFPTSLSHQGPAQKTRPVPQGVTINLHKHYIRSQLCSYISFCMCMHVAMYSHTSSSIQLSWLMARRYSMLQISVATIRDSLLYAGNCSIFHNNCTQKHSYKKTPYYPSTLLARLVQVNPLYSILCSRFSFLPCGFIYFFTLVILHDAFLSF